MVGLRFIQREQNERVNFEACQKGSLPIRPSTSIGQKLGERITTLLYLHLRGDSSNPSPQNILVDYEYSTYMMCADLKSRSRLAARASTTAQHHTVRYLHNGPTAKS